MSGLTALDWSAISALEWRQRNAEIERAIRLYLAGVSGVVSTFDLAKAIAPTATGDQQNKLSQIMTRMAPYLAPFATHDGENIQRYGRVWRRWRWHGQTGES